MFIISWLIDSESWLLGVLEIEIQEQWKTMTQLRFIECVIFLINQLLINCGQHTNTVFNECEIHIHVAWISCSQCSMPFFSPDAFSFALIKKESNFASFPYCNIFGHCGIRWFLLEREYLIVLRISKPAGIERIFSISFLGKQSTSCRLPLGWLPVYQ